MLEKGHPLPDFSLPDQEGALRAREDFAGRWLVLYCYPKDNTSACTLEASEFTALAEEFARIGAAVAGISPDTVKSHASFATQRELGIILLSDPEHDLLQSLGAWQVKKLYGKEYMGVVRSTFLVDPQSTVREVWPKVRAAGHAEAVLARLKEILKQS